MHCILCIFVVLTVRLPPRTPHFGLKHQICRQGWISAVIMRFPFVALLQQPLPRTVELYLDGGLPIQHPRTPHPASVLRRD
ncbi:hypothetical protein F5148DRAFT_1175029 [Russula earlei]|uniref:Uncharacterized protein n=1 Tax=Russula earlei TaxID=71964 RepID=A0ACC0UIU7_9AGAM|nr:hypothetical protein F5148DRAFT_1175029 [Russula earlei]